ncbi:unnamed protein product [Chrysoparadoxa australica]
MSAHSSHLMVMRDLVQSLDQGEDEVQQSPEGGEQEPATPPQPQGESYFSQKVQATQLLPGDHIYVWRGAIQHHGIVVSVPGVTAEQVDAGEHPPQNAANEEGAGITVAHFDATFDAVRLESLSDFLSSSGARSPGKLRRARYRAGLITGTITVGAAYYCEPLPRVDTVKRAKAAVISSDEAGAWTGYNIVANNCEHFCSVCKTGRRPLFSKQAEKALIVGTGLLAGGGYALGGAIGGAELLGITAMGRHAKKLRDCVHYASTVGVAVSATAAVLNDVSDACVNGNLVEASVKTLKTTVNYLSMGSNIWKAASGAVASGATTSTSSTRGLAGDW